MKRRAQLTTMTGDAPTSVPLRFHMATWQRWLFTLLSLAQLLQIAMDPSPLGIAVGAFFIAYLPAIWLVAVTVVDDTGVTTPSGWWRRRIPWTDVRQFAVGATSGRPVLVLADGRPKRLVFVPDEAYTELHTRWLRAVGPSLPTN